MTELPRPKISLLNFLKHLSYFANSSTVSGNLISFKAIASKLKASSVLALNFCFVSLIPLVSQLFRFYLFGWDCSIDLLVRYLRTVFSFNSLDCISGLVLLSFYNSKNLNCIKALSFFTIQRIWILLGRCLFFKICSHIFIIFEVKLEWWFWSRRNRKWSKKNEWFCGVIFFRSNFKVEWENGVWTKFRFLASGFLFTCVNFTLVFFLIFWIGFFSKWFSQSIHSSFQVLFFV